MRLRTTRAPARALLVATLTGLLAATVAFLAAIGFN
jgi:hypothetical protein